LNRQDAKGAKRFNKLEAMWLSPFWYFTLPFHAIVLLGDLGVLAVNRLFLG
jgi:hypothetical protein